MDAVSKGIITSVIILITPICGFIIKKMITNTIDTYFNEKVEKYRHELNLLAEEKRFDFKRKTEDFSLYTTKKHEIYLEFYELMLNAHGKIMGLMGLRHSLTFEEFNKEDIRDYLVKQNIVTGKTEELLTIWDEDKERAISKMNEYLTMIECQKANDYYNQSRNYFYKSQIYFSENLIETIQILLNKLFAIYTIYQPIRVEEVRLDDISSREELTDLKNDIENLLNKATNQMKKELSVGYYKD